MKLRNPMNKWGMWRHDISFSEKLFWSVVSINYYYNYCN